MGLSRSSLVRKVTAPKLRELAASAENDATQHITMDLQTVHNLPEYSRKEVQQQAGENWMIINDLVYDLTEFLNVHPGGAEVLYEYVGLDATTVFQDVGHSASAQRHMMRYVIGRVVESECTYRDRSEFACQASATLCAMKGVIA